MTRKITPILVLMLLAGLALAAAMPVLGQSEEQERSRFLSYVEEQLSGPGRTIRIEGIEGALSSSATIAAITIADDEGVWLRIEDAAIEWTRSALFRGRLEIESLRAARIDWPRMAVPPEGLPAPEAGSFEVPEIPLAIEIGALEIEQANLGEPLFGLAAQLSGTGALSLEDGSLDARFDVTRLDGPGGELSLQAAYANASTQLDLDISLTEPADGVIANVLNLEGQPPVSLALQGGGPLDALDVELTLDTDAGRILSGQLLTQEQPGGRAFATALEGPISALIAPTYRGFFGARSSVMADGFLADEGSMILNDLTVESGALSLAAAAATAPDGFPTRLALDARFVGDAGRSVLLPVPGESTRAAGGRLLVNYGDEDQQNGAWTAQLRLQDVESGTLSVARTALDLSGTTRNLADAQTRAISFDGLGEATGFEGNEVGVAQALGNGLQVQTQGSWQAGAPVL
ncbi:MAG: translocation/assembly module TamB, partial [Devosiaceae bacterium]